MYHDCAAERKRAEVSTKVRGSSVDDSEGRRFAGRRTHRQRSRQAHPDMHKSCQQRLRRDAFEAVVVMKAAEDFALDDAKAVGKVVALLVRLERLSGQRIGNR